MIYLPPREHGPPHVHVWKAGMDAVIGLKPVAVRDAEQMRAADVAAAVELIEANLNYLLKEWSKRHG